MLKARDTGKDVSEALKAAIAARREGTIGAEADDMLGQVLFNIARWCVADRDRTRLGDEDLISDLTVHLLSKLDKVDTSRGGASAVVYLKTAADNKFKDMLRDAGRAKRRAVLVELEPHTVTTDFFGRIIDRN